MKSSSPHKLAAYRQGDALESIDYEYALGKLTVLVTRHGSLRQVHLHQILFYVDMDWTVHGIGINLRADEGETSVCYYDLHSDSFRTPDVGGARMSLLVSNRDYLGTHHFQRNDDGKWACMYVRPARTPRITP